MFSITDFLSAYNNAGTGNSSPWSNYQATQGQYAGGNGYGMQPPNIQGAALDIPGLMLPQEGQLLRRIEEQQPQFNMGMVLPPKGSITAQATPTASGFQTAPTQSQPVGANASNQQGWLNGIQALGQNQGQAGFGFGQGFEPNLLLKLAAGYNRGGLLGALGMAMTDFNDPTVGAPRARVVDESKLY